MKKYRLLCVIFILILVFSALFPVATASTADITVSNEVITTEPGFVADSLEEASIIYGSHTIEGKMPVFGSSKYLQTSAAAFLYETNSDTVLYAWNPDTPMYPASLVKIMTALIALETEDHDKTVTVTAAAMSAAQAEQIMPKLQVGQPITIKQLVYCLLVGSENDAAVVLADQIAGSQQGFVSLMNKRAQELGCTGTKFMNPHGLHHEEQVTTARDMARILSFAIKNEAFAECFGTKSFTLAATSVSEERSMETTNDMIMPSMPQYYYKYVTGGRTGINDNRERCLAVTAEKDDLSLISVVLGAKPTFEQDGVTTITTGNFEETKELLDLGFEGNSVMQVLGEGQILAQYPVNNGSNAVAIGCTKSVSTVLPSGTHYDNLSVRFANNFMNLDAPVNKDDVITSVQIWYGNVCVASAEMIAMNGSVPEHTASLTESDDTGSSSTSILDIVLIVVALIIGFAGVMHIVQSVRDGSMLAHYKRRRRDRRRTK